MCFWGWAALGSFEFLLPLFGQALRADATTIGLLFSVFSISALGLRAGLGPLLDRVARRPILIGGLVMYVAALTTFALARTVELVVVARLLQGVGSTAVWLTAAVLLAEWNEGGQATGFGRYQMISVWGAGLATAWTGLATALFDAATRAEITRYIRLPSWYPAPWSQLALLHLIFAGNALCALVALLMAMRVHELPRRAPTQRLRLHVPAVLVPLIAVAAISGIADGLLAPVQIILLDARFGKGLLGIGVVYAVPGIIYACVPGAAGRWADRHGYRRAAAMGLLLPVICYLWLPWTSSIVGWAALLCVEALGLSLATPALFALVAQAAPVERGNGYGLFTFAGGIGAALAQGAGGWLYDHAGRPVPFLIAGGCMALGALACRYVRSTK